ncbi:DUF7401 domain-containing protein [Xenorhabdus mauleonii]|uniref:DUF7401 domain-containing protein n=1 Tax=Xenorhabdus mauleonii TaxID=351675 RepID=UPI001473283B|nr:hypothetical protein [Xenorhabdus mauleonii]
MKATLKGPLQINMSGIWESMLNLDPELSIAGLIRQLETKVNFYLVSSEWLG